MTDQPTGAGSAPTRDGRTLHLERHGAGSPVVVFESGMGMSRNSWGAVVERVAPHTATVVYDRSGTGRSPATDGPRDLAHLADDLVDLLDHLGERAYVLVGHSWGGPIVRSAAALRPDLVAGLVLVDQTDERCDLFFEKGNQRQAAWGLKVLPLLARAGVIRRMVRKVAADLPEPWRSRMGAEDTTVAAARAQVAELTPSIDDLRRLRDHPLVLPDVPVTVISGTQDGFLERGRRPGLLVAHRATAAAAPQGRYVEATASSHYVPFTEPQLVADEVLRIVSAAG